MGIPQVMPQLQLSLVREVIEAHRAIRSPIETTYLGHEFLVRPNVFSPFLAPSGIVSLLFSAWPMFRGKRILDIGCGAGIQAALIAMSGAAKVVGVDINLQAVLNAKENSRRLRISHLVEFREGNLFSPIAPTETFDLIFADLPLVSGKPDDDLERAFLDEDLSSIRRFLEEVPKHLQRAQHGASAYLCRSSLEGSAAPPSYQYCRELSMITALAINVRDVDFLLSKIRVKS